MMKLNRVLSCVLTLVIGLVSQTGLAASNCIDGVCTCYNKKAIVLLDPQYVAKEFFCTCTSPEEPTYILGPFLSTPSPPQEPDCGSFSGFGVTCVKSAGTEYKECDLFDDHSTGAYPVFGEPNLSECDPGCFEIPPVRQISEERDGVCVVTRTRFCEPE